MIKARLQNMFKPEREDSALKYANCDYLVRKVAGIEKNKEAEEEGLIVAAIKKVYSIHQQL